MKRRILLSLSGVVLCAVSVGIFKFAALGVDPFTSLTSGLDTVIPLSYGTVYLLLNLALLGFSLVTDRSSIGPATFMNLFLLGYLVEFTSRVLAAVFPDPTLGLRIAALLTGVVLVSLSLSMYITADLGVSAYDVVAIAMNRRWKIASFGRCRVLTDMVCVGAGAALFVLGGGSLREIPAIVGVGTVLTAFCMGPMIEYFNRRISRPLLKRA